MSTSQNPQLGNKGEYISFLRAYEAAVAEYKATCLKKSIQHEGFTNTLKKLKKTKPPRTGMLTVIGGVLEESSYGSIDAALETEDGRVVISGGKRTDREPTDPQTIPTKKLSLLEVANDTSRPTSEDLLSRFTQATDAEATPHLICKIELAHFGDEQRSCLLPLLWQYILSHRNSNAREQLIAVGAAIRKYIAIMPMDRMGDLATLLESGHKSHLPVELEIEVAKMIYRNFEVLPPADPDPQPELADRLWEIVELYMNPRLLLRDKHAAAASSAIEAIVAMRSRHAQRALQAANGCSYRWFAELVSDDLDELRDRWDKKNKDAVAWLDDLRQTSQTYA